MPAEKEKAGRFGPLRPKKRRYGPLGVKREPAQRGPRCPAGCERGSRETHHVRGCPVARLEPRLAVAQVVPQPVLDALWNVLRAVLHEHTFREGHKLPTGLAIFKRDKWSRLDAYWLWVGSPGSVIASLVDGLWLYAAAWAIWIPALFLKRMRREVLLHV